MQETTSGLPPSVIDLVDKFASFPGVGRKSALRMALFVMRSNRSLAEEISEAVLAVKDRIANCSKCGILSEQDPCPICSDTHRDQSMICVVEEAGDVIAIERTSGWRGVYHVLGGAISPLDGIGPDELSIDELGKRIEADSVSELVVATNATSEGETTALYLARQFKPKGVKVTRIARGIPIGSDIELVDDNTLHQSIEGRSEI